MRCSDITTLKEVAAAANVSMMTVSNVINGHHSKVSRDTIARINKLIEEMNYVPNANARSLSTSRSNLIAMCIGNQKGENLLKDPYNSFIVSAVSRHAQENGYTLLLEDVSSLSVTMSSLKSWNVAGAIFLGFTGPELERIQKTLSIPFICLDSYPSSPDIISVGTNDYQAGRLAGLYLTNLGHRHIALASGTTILEKEAEQLNPLLYYRYLGFREVLAEKNAPLNEAAIFTGDISFEQGVRVGTALSLHPAVTAIFCTADILAAGVIEGLRLSGRKIPQEMSVLGFDNLPIAEYLYPKLTTIHQQNALKGENAVKLLVSAIENPGANVSSVQYDVQIIERQTTLPL